MRTARHLATVLGRSERTVRSWAQDGCPSYVIGGCRRFRESEVRLWLEQREPALRPKPPLKPGLVYFVGAAKKWPVKIGWTVRVDGRIPSLQTGTWESLICHGTLPGTKADEMAIHAELEPYRIRGEWFEREPALALLASRSRNQPQPRPALDTRRDKAQ
jgi:hypothetical protein